MILLIDFHIFSRWLKHVKTTKQPSIFVGQSARKSWRKLVPPPEVISLKSPSGLDPSSVKSWEVIGVCRGFTDLFYFSIIYKNIDIHIYIYYTVYTYMLYTYIIIYICVMCIYIYVKLLFHYPSDWPFKTFSYHHLPKLTWGNPHEGPLLKQQPSAGR